MFDVIKFIQKNTKKKLLSIKINFLNVIWIPFLALKCFLFIY